MAGARLLFVCLGNICRSPLAQAVMEDLVAAAGLGDRISCDSAGTGGWHVGEPPDPRAVAAARRHGLPMDHRGRQVRGPDDLRPFDLVLAMDRSNLVDLGRLQPPEWAPGRIRLLRSYDPDADHDEVPDPYHLPDAAFDEVLTACRAACRGLLRSLADDAG